MACCGAPGHLRRSKNGIQHFYHAVDGGCHYKDESKEHLEIKYLVYRACQSEGWETHLEFPAPDRTWISDIYAVKEGRKVVFEIQLSTITPIELEARDAKYRAEGIESYWLLENNLERSRDFASWYYCIVFKDDKRREETIPYIDKSLFETGPENHLFIAKGIRSVGLDAKKQALFTTHRPELPIADWVRHVLHGNYGKYLESFAVAFHQKRKLKEMAAPDLLRFRDFYHDILRYETYRKKVGSLYRIFKTDAALKNDKSLQHKFNEMYSEIAWLTNEYRLFTSESYGLFYWKKIPDYDTPVPFFRLESESKIHQLNECVKRLSQWEESFNTALHKLEREFSPQLKQYDDRH